jgi:hypothetical protein
MWSARIWALVILGTVFTIGVVAVPALSASAGEALSPGCQWLNDPAFDGLYRSDQIFDTTMFPREQIVFTASPPDTVGDFAPQSAELLVLVGTKQLHEDYPGTIRYTVDSSDALDDFDVSWSLLASAGPGNPPATTTWDVSCHKVAGFISGTITPSAFPPYASLFSPRADLFDEAGDYLETVVASNGGSYTTHWLPAGAYYVLLYNGDDEGFIDYFPQWYPNTPLSLVDTPNLVTVSSGEVSGIDGSLDLFFLDMWSSVFVDDIAWMHDTGITKGCGNDRYCPDGAVTRGQMAAFLVRALGLVDDGGGDLFIDDDDSIFEGDIDRLAAAGITKGCNPPTNDRFCPDSKVTREQMAAFLVRAIGYVDDGGGNLFIDDDDSIFENDIDKLATAGVTRGCNPPVNDMYCPGSVVTRGQMAAFLHRALG